jgi:hypothetical protein
MYKYKHLDLANYFDEDDAIDIIVFFKSGDHANITDIMGSVSIDEQFLSVQQTGRYAKSFYFDADSVRYFAINPRENGNAWKNAAMSREAESDLIDETFNLED